MYVKNPAVKLADEEAPTTQDWETGQAIAPTCSEPGPVGVSVLISVSDHTPDDRVAIHKSPALFCATGPTMQDVTEHPTEVAQRAVVPAGNVGGISSDQVEPSNCQMTGCTPLCPFGSPPTAVHSVGEPQETDEICVPLGTAGDGSVCHVDPLNWKNSASEPGTLLTSTHEAALEHESAGCAYGEKLGWYAAGGAGAPPTTEFENSTASVGV